MDRYKKLVSFDAPMWSEGSPVVIEKGALLFDSARNQNLLQLKLRNVQNKPVKAVVLDIEQVDVKSNSSGWVQHAYLDLNAANGVSFGDGDPVHLTDKTVRDFHFRIADVVFADGSSWTSETLAQLVPPASTLSELGDLKEQYLREVGLSGGASAPQVLPTESGGLWYCACGALNDSTNADCSVCGRNGQRQCAATNTAFLARRKEESTSALRAAEKQKSAQLKRTRKIAAIGVTIIVTMALVSALVLTVIIPATERNAAAAARTAEYDAAEAALDKGDFDEAIAAFTELAKHEDSPAKADQARAGAEYARGMKWLDAGEHHNAALRFRRCVELGGYRDVSEQLAVAESTVQEDSNYSEYQWAVASMDKSLERAAREFKEIPADYKDTAELLAFCEMYAELDGIYVYGRVSGERYSVGVRPFAEEGEPFLALSILGSSGPLAELVDSLPESGVRFSMSGSTAEFTAGGISGTVDGSRLIIGRDGKTLTLSK